MIAAAYLGFALISFRHDKLVHFAVFATLTAEIYFLFDIHKPWTLTFVLATFGCFALEYLQSFVNPARMFDAEDILYNFIGSMAALVSCVIFQQCRSQPSNTDLETWTDVGVEMTAAHDNHAQEMRT